MVIIGMDPPEHRVFRSIVAKAFTPKMISQLGDRCGRRPPAGDRRAARAHARCEFVADVAARIPMWSISELMGVPEGDRHRLYELSHALIDDQDPEVAPTPETSMNASAEIFGYASEMAARERANPSGSLTSALLEAEVDGRRLTDMEFTLFFIFLIVAGNETTRTATSHGLLSLLDHPDQLERLARDPDLMASAVEEILRWEPPIHHFRRTATADVELGGQPIAKGDKVLMWYAGANRDPVGVRRSALVPHGPFAEPTPVVRDRRALLPRAPTWPGCRFGCSSASCSPPSRTSELEAPPRRLHSNLINGIKELRIAYDVRED